MRDAFVFPSCAVSRGVGGVGAGKPVAKVMEFFDGLEGVCGGDGLAAVDGGVADFF